MADAPQPSSSEIKFAKLSSLNSAAKFIRHCKYKFGWSDMSREVIMDIGCGDDLNIGKTIIKEFPDVRAVIAIDKDEKAICVSRGTTRVECEVADIEKRDTLERYLEKMTKVISHRTFHELGEQQTAFQNVYDLLRPGGEAALLFLSTSSSLDWLVEMLKIPKWRNLYRDYFSIDSFSYGLPKQRYLEMVQKIGFKIIQCSEDKTVMAYKTDAECKEKVYAAFGSSFKVPSELLEEFKEETLQVFIRVNGRNGKGRPSDRKSEVTLLLVKPTEGASS